MKPKVSKKILDLIKRNRGIKLDLGCGESRQEGFVGLDRRKCKNVDIVHDIEKFPFPLPAGCCTMILCSHLIEHIDPSKMIDLFDELWRILEEKGQLLISMPYGASYGFQQDPTHKNMCNEATWTYYDPDHGLYEIYRPLPWKIERSTWFATGNMEVIMIKRPKSYRGAYSVRGEGASNYAKS